jgi:hypothetical protein
VVARSRLLEPESQLIMLKSLLRIGGLSLLALALAAMPARVLAQTTNTTVAGKKPAAESKATAKAEKKPSAHPFRGKLAALDQAAKTITVGKSTYQITSETRIKKAGKPATLADGVVGEDASGYVKPAEGGKLVATSVNFGPRPEKSPGKKKTDGGEKAKQ